MVWGLVFGNRLLGDAATPGSMTNPITETLKVLSANIRGISDQHKQCDVIDYIKNMHPDLVCLIDTHLLDADINELKKRKYSIHKYFFFVMFELHIKVPHTTTTHQKR